MPTYLEQSLAKLKEFEGSIPWMYLDTVGKVTVGVGIMLPNASAAERLPFQLTGREATQGEIGAEFARVDAMPVGRAALFYRHPGGPELAQTEIDSLLAAVLAGFEGQLRGRFHAYDSFPDGVKMALLDMIYNLGPKGLLDGFPRLVQAVEAGNWAQAAANCFRHGPGAARNQWTQRMFLGTVVPSMTASAESGLAQVAYGLVGMGAAAAGWAAGKLRK